MVVNSESLSLALPTDKKGKLTALCQRLLKRKSPPLRDVATLLGHFAWAISAVPYSQAIADIKWWVKALLKSKGCTFASNPDLTIYADASRLGWGFHCDGTSGRGPWTSADLRRHINELELLAALYAVQSMTKNSRGLSILLYLDNTTAVAYINRGGGTHSKHLCELARLLFDWCEDRNLFIRAIHLPGVQNTQADEQSRILVDSSDWRLSTPVFNHIMNIWPAEVDLFSCAWNAQLHRFNSKLPQPGAMACNAFAISWANFIGYAFPPFCLVSRCISKMQKEKADLVLDNSTFSQSINLSDGRVTPAAIEQAPYHAIRLEAIKQRLRKGGFSEGVIELLVAANRPSTTAAYQSAWTTWSSWCLRRGAQFNLSQPRKSQRTGALRSISLRRFTNPLTCPVTCMENYIDRTACLTESQNRSYLWLSLRKPHKPVGASTLGRWIKLYLKEANVDPYFTAHSIRGAAASHAALAGVPIDTILRTADWSRESTFNRFYRRDIIAPSVAEAFFQT
ncbi:reverse transcriptase [Daphnia sinensis]|uniref:Reverse transcriptase n=1 Tax=Daphnia sinensis TaxID=1820382 RepID=A0AAD5L6Y3_9CRUS|nr:reverse transcriptase [Daphnia sinensis]